MAAARGKIILSSLLVSFFIQACYGAVLFSELQNNMQVSTSFNQNQGQVLKAGDDAVTITWGPNRNLPAGTDNSYDTVKVKLCFAPISQQDRAWRRTEENLSKDKTCQFTIHERPYNRSLQTLDWTVERHIPTGTYFVRAYVHNGDGKEVAYGQSTNDQKSTNLFEVQAISGRHLSLDIASICFSAFSVLSLFGFFFVEKRKARRLQQK